MGPFTLHEIHVLRLAEVLLQRYHQTAPDKVLKGIQEQAASWDMADAQVTNLFSGYVGGMLGEHAANPGQNWKAKDCALYLVTALTVRGRTAAQGATTTNQLVNIPDFFQQQVGPSAISPAAKQSPGFSGHEAFCVDAVNAFHLAPAPCVDFALGQQHACGVAAVWAACADMFASEPMPQHPLLLVIVCQQ